jgi:Fe-S cluster biogenesis protein NfuA
MMAPDGILTQAEGSHGLCGDRFVFYQTLKPRVAYGDSGESCFVGRSVSALLCKTLTYRTPKEAKGFLSDFARWIQNPSQDMPSPDLGDFAYLKDFPVRRKCVLTPIQTFERLLSLMLQFRIQSTPNPNARKYVLNKPLKAEGKVSYTMVSQCDHIPMAEALLNLPGVTQVHFFENCLTLTQDGTIQWSKLDHGAQSLMAEHMETHDIHFVDHTKKTAQRAPLSPELEEIDQILERTIRPGLQMDGGDMEPLALEANILTVRYMGACGGCPSSMTATLDAVTQILREEYRADLEVVAL